VAAGSVAEGDCMAEGFGDCCNFQPRLTLRLRARGRNGSGLGPCAIIPQQNGGNPVVYLVANLDVNAEFRINRCLLHTQPKLVLRTRKIRQYPVGLANS